MRTDPDYLLRGRKIKKLVEYSCEEFREKYDLKQIDIDVLAYLSVNSGTNACVIAKNLDLHKGQLSMALNHLAKLGYVVEYHDPQDHRYMHYMTTDKGKPLIEEIKTYKIRLKKQMFKGFTSEEISELEKLMKKLAANLDEAIENV